MAARLPIEPERVAALDKFVVVVYSKNKN